MLKIESLVAIIIKVHILVFMMVVKVLKLDNPKQGYAHLTFRVVRSMIGEIGFQSLELIIGSIANWASHVGFKL